jgi:hypothetical protein
MQPMRLVQFEESRTEKLSQFARSGAAQLVHLEEAVLSLDVAHGTRQIESVLGVDVRSSERIAPDDYLSRQTGALQPAVQLGEASREQCVNGSCANRQQAQNRHGRVSQPTEHTPPLCVGRMGNSRRFAEKSHIAPP